MHLFLRLKMHCLDQWTNSGLQRPLHVILHLERKPNSGQNLTHVYNLRCKVHYQRVESLSDGLIMQILIIPNNYSLISNDSFWETNAPLCLYAQKIWTSSKANQFVVSFQSSRAPDVRWGSQSTSSTRLNGIRSVLKC